MRSIIGVTGGIASGKSTLLSILEEHGFVTISSDKIVKRLYDKGAPGYTELTRLGIEGILDAEGNIDKAALRDLVFSDGGIRDKVERAIHPLVISEIQKEIQANRNSDLAVEIPLLFEAGLEKMFSHIVTVYATEEMMVQNIVSRYGLEKDKALEMISTQMDLRSKMDRSDFVVMNTGTVQELRQKAVKLIETIRKKEKGHGKR